MDNNLSNTLTGAHATPKMPDSFDIFQVQVQDHFTSLKLDRHNNPLFHAVLPEGVDLAEIFRTHLPVLKQQEHNCFCCTSFFHRFGNLVYVDDNGKLHSALWEPEHVPNDYHMAVTALKEIVEKMGRIERVYVGDTTCTIGTAATGEWRHLHVKNIDMSLGKFNFGFHPNEYMTDLRILNESLASYSGDSVKNMVNLFETGAVPDAERFAAPARWFMMIRAGLNKFAVGTSGTNRRNWMLREIVKAPVGFARPANTVIGTFLDDMRDGASFDTAKANFLKKVNPINYQRPTAEASEGNIAQAEKIIEALGCEKSLIRRYGRLEDLQFQWKPTEEVVAAATESKGVFDHLKKSKEQPHEEMVNTTGVKISWVKFAREILPKALEMHVKTRPQMCFGGFATAVHLDAPPILRWDHADKRNPVSWWVRYEKFMGRHVAFVSPLTFKLRVGDWVAVQGVTNAPALWNDPEHFAEAYGGMAMLVLEGARDISDQSKSSFLFPETMKSDFHAIRATIENYSQTTPAQGREEDHAIFTLFSGAEPMTIRVKTEMGTTLYDLERWE